MAGFEYRQALEIRDVFKRHQVRYLFIGQSGAILLGYPDTTQDADLFVEKDVANCEDWYKRFTILVFHLRRHKLRKSAVERFSFSSRMVPDLDLIFAPDGIEKFDDAQTSCQSSQG